MLKRKIIQVSIVLVLGLVIFKFLFVSLKPYSAKEQPFIVRVRIEHNASELKLKTGEKGCEVRDAETGDVLGKKIMIPGVTKVLPAGDGIDLGGRVFKARRIRISPLGRNSLILNGVIYRGEMDIAITDKGLDAINRVKLEDYLKGVVPQEVHRFWPFAVIKAQAIVSRSFAVYQVLRRKDKEYDLTADTFSQVYGGQSSERWRTTRAVEATRGRVLEYGGKILPAYFHSCCGGHTQDASRIWGESPEYSGTGQGPGALRGVKCPWCRWTPHFRWQVRVSTHAILERLNNKGYQIDKIDDIREGRRDKSGRLEYVRIKSRNKWFEITIEDFRAAIGGKVLRSANFRIKKYPLFYLFSGYGWGHGVGMCQWGAFGLGLRRWSAKRILEHYYPGAEIVDLSNVLKEQEKSK
jgi:stage II sporulation protein D